MFGRPNFFRQKGFEMKTAFIFGLILSAYAYCNFMALDESAARADLILAELGLDN